MTSPITISPSLTKTTAKEKSKAKKFTANQESFKQSVSIKANSNIWTPSDRIAPSKEKAQEEIANTTSHLTSYQDQKAKDSMAVQKK